MHFALRRGKDEIFTNWKKGIEAKLGSNKGCQWKNLKRDPRYLVANAGENILAKNYISRQAN